MAWHQYADSSSSPSLMDSTALPSITSWREAPPTKTATTETGCGGLRRRVDVDTLTSLVGQPRAGAPASAAGPTCWWSRQRRQQAVEELALLVAAGHPQRLLAAVEQ